MGLDLPNGKLGMWLFLGTEIMFFTAFIGSYIVLRLGSPGWPENAEDTHIVIWAGALNTFVLICSSVSVVFALEGMRNKDFQKARKCIAITLLLSFVFLGIKGYEYYGKFSHDILPGHIPENDRQALQFTIHHLMAATGIDEEQYKLKVLEKRLNEKQTQGGDTTSLQKDVDAQKEVVAGITPISNKVVALNDLVKAEKIKLGEPQEHGEHSATKGAEPTMQHEVEKLREEFPDKFGSVHVPRVIRYGNLFASTYFIMTGFHALHVLVGILMFIILLAFGSKLSSQHEVFVENTGLYWHFVDLVWIFLFPLIYIV
jgi:cytochrome c oxidase subunit 3